MTNTIKNWAAVAAGEQDVKINEVPAFASISINPGVGGTMDVLARVSDNGPQYSLVGGPASKAMLIYTQGSFYEIQFVAVTAAGVAEWNWPKSQYNTPN